MARIGIILELDSTYYEALSAAKQFPALTIEVVKVKNYDEGIAIAKSMVEGGTEVLISRAGYIPKLRAASIVVPIVEIPFSVGNLLYQLVSAKNAYEVVGLVATKSILDSAKEIEYALGSNIHYYEVSSVEDYEAVAFTAKADGVKILVGGYDETRFASQVGLESIILRTSSEDVLAALIEAKKFTDKIDEQNKRKEELNTLLNIVGEGLILYNSKGDITFVNQTAITMFEHDSFFSASDRKQPEPWLDKIRSVINSNEAILNSIEGFNDTKYLYSIYPISDTNDITGAVLKIQRVADIQGIEQNIRSRLSKQGLIALHTFNDIVGSSASIKDTIAKAKRYSSTDSTILITGESGTGKELLAQGIHNSSLRASGPFVAINCAAIPPTLLESELFGYKEGAFTGAKKGGKIGLFELAHNGTLFLDEVGEIDISIQPRLLRALEERRIMRLGDDRTIPVNVRIIAATNKNLHEMILNHQFREDFYYRLNVLALEIPPLRARKEDLEALIDHFLLKKCTALKRPLPRVSPEAMKALASYNWPGNIRELSNIIERLVVISLKNEIDQNTVKEAMGNTLADHSLQEELRPTTTSQKAEYLKAEELVIIQRVLNECHGNKTEAASRLGISRPTLYKKLQHASS